ncbi:tyrosine-type recombinase/integrase [Motiliproteus sp.]|uniref:tyrosine-type recombinase/integrase n=1 Tax=Motiliproteus sp. TaxID=1898955 RepID=UPI003BA96438
MPDGYEVRKKTVRVYFYWEGELCRETIGPTTTKNIEQAKRLAKIIRYEIDSECFDYSRHFPDSPRVLNSTLGHYLDLLLAIKENELAFSSYRGIESKARNHIRPKWGAMQIKDIDHLDLQEWIRNDLKKLHSKTIKEIVSILRQVFVLYSTRNKTAFNPTDGITIRLPDAEDPDPFTLDEINKILSTPTKRVQELNLIKFMLWDGPRLSEAMALAWEDVISLEKGLVRFQRAQVRNRFKITKTKRSTRAHKLLKPAHEALLEQYSVTGHLPPIEVEVKQRDNRTVRSVKIRPVFRASRANKPLYGDQAIRERFWKVHLKRAGVRYRGPNQCRHTFISQMLSTGEIPLHWIAQHVGHTTTEMIQKTYGKWIRQDGADIYTRIEQIFDL